MIQLANQVFFFLDKNEKQKYEFNQWFVCFRNTFINLECKNVISGENQEIPALVIMNCFNTEMILDR